MQTEVLEKMPEAPIRVYAIFFEIVASDEGARARVDPREILHDPRVVHFWDRRQAAGRWFDENVTHVGRREGQRDRVEWDAFILYDAGVTWSEEPPWHVSWGRPLLSERLRLLRDLEGSLARRDRG